MEDFIRFYISGCMLFGGFVFFGVAMWLTDRVFGKTHFIQAINDWLDHILTD